MLAITETVKGTYKENLYQELGLKFLKKYDDIVSYDIDDIIKSVTFIKYLTNIIPWIPTQ